VNEENTVTEWCPHCEAEVRMEWNVDRDGFVAYCPHCGNLLLLCDECRHNGPEGESLECSHVRCQRHKKEFVLKLKELGLKVPKRFPKGAFV